MSATEHSVEAETAVDRLVEILTARRDISELPSVVHAEHELRQSVADLPPIFGPRRLERLLRFYHRGLSDFAIAIGDDFWDGRVRCMRVEMEATHYGPIGLIAGTNRRVRFGAFATFEVLGSVVARSTLHVDGVALLTGIGGIELRHPLVEGTSSGAEP